MSRIMRTVFEDIGRKSPGLLQLRLAGLTSSNNAASPMQLMQCNVMAGRDVM
jgi:hypothetical protein